MGNVTPKAKKSKVSPAVRKKESYDSLTPEQREEAGDLNFSDSLHIHASLVTDFPLLRKKTTPQKQQDRQQQQPQMTQSMAFRHGELDAMRTIMTQVDQTAAKRMAEGFHEVNFTLGVLNCFVVCFVFANMPHNFWLLYLIESLYFIPAKFQYMIKAEPLNEAFYYLDLCWCLNFCGILSLIGFPLCHALDIVVSDDLRKHVYLATMGASLGILLGASILLPFVSLLFHDARTMTGLFIHVLPPMLAYTLRWHSHEIHSHWPQIFHLTYLEKVQFFPDTGPFFLPVVGGLGSVAGNTIALYFAWFVPYVLFMLWIGMDLPRKNRRAKNPDGTPKAPVYDTVFHSTLRGGLAVVFGKVFFGRPKEISLRQMEDNDYEWRDFVLYMTIHATLAMSSIFLLALPCFTYKKFHQTMLVVLVVLCVHRGSKRYTYYTTAMYGRLIRKHFETMTRESAKSD